MDSVDIQKMLISFDRQKLNISRVANTANMTTELQKNATIYSTVWNSALAQRINIYE